MGRNNNKNDFLIEVYNAEREQFNKTRELQWKINIAFWSLLVLGIKYSDEIFVNSKGESIIFFIILLVSYIVYVCGIQHSLNENKKFWQGAFNSRFRTVHIHNHRAISDKNDKEDTNKIFIRSLMWVALQISITLSLLYILVQKCEGFNIQPLGTICFIFLLILIISSLVFLCVCFYEE